MDTFTKDTFFERNKYIFMSIFISSLILLITFVAAGFFPFGQKSLLRVDLYHQYAPFHEELRRKLLTGDSLFYSWSGGLGKEFLSQMAYYTLSPLSFLIVLFPTNVLPESIMLFTFIKIVACSATFSFYLKKSFKTNNLSIVIFAIMYSFMAYITSFYWNIMWLDSIAVFPIVALGIERLVKDGAYKTYLISLAIAIMVNFYIAFLVCVFATLYFLVKVFSEYSLKDEFKTILNRMGSFAIVSLLAGGLTMFLAFPTALAIFKTDTSETANFPPFQIYKNVYQIITNHFSGARPIILARNEDLPNVYSGVMTLLLLPVYFANPKFKRKEKALFGGLITFMILCSVIKPLDFLIHGMHFPANLPHRYTFIYSFILLTLGFKAFKDIKHLNIKVLIGSGIFYIFIINFTEYFLVKKISEIDIVLSKSDIISNVILLGIYTVILILYKVINSKDIQDYSQEDKKSNLSYSVVFTLIFALSSVSAFVYYLVAKSSKEELGFSEKATELWNKINELGGNTLFLILTTIVVLLIIFISCFIFNIIKNSEKLRLNILLVLLLFVVSGEVLANSLNGFLYNGGTTRSSYIKYMENTDQMLKYIKEMDKDENKFYRQEFRRFTTINDASLYGYNGFSTFSSLASGATSNMMEKLGIAATSNSYRYYDPTPLVDAIFNIKYIMDKDNTLTNKDYTHVKDFGNVSFYKNDKYLSLGFMVDPDIQQWDLNADTPFLVQNDFAKKATGVEEDLTTKVHVMNFEFENLDAKEDKKVESKYSYKLHNPKDLKLIPKVTASVYNPKEQRLFLYVDAPNAKRFKYTINGHTQDREISTGRSLIDCGVVASGEIINIEFTLDRKGEHEKTYRKDGVIKLFSAGFEKNVFEKVYNELKDEVLLVNNYTSTSIEGKINALNDGVMFTSIPYDEGWSVFVDGVLTEIQPIGENGLIGVPLTKGEHDIVFKFKVSGFATGIILSIVSLISLIIYIVFKNKSKNIKC